MIYNHESPKLRLIKAYNEALEKGDENKLENLFQELTDMDAWDLEAKVNQLLSVFKLEDATQLIKNLSGGQKKRVALIKVLLSDAEFLFLDEPTNHLDLDMIEWLESHLSTSKSTILMVTHDRYFLEVVCDTIFELAEQSLFKYKETFLITWKKKPKDRSKCNPPLKKREILSGRVGLDSKTT